MPSAPAPAPSQIGKLSVGMHPNIATLHAIRALKASIKLEEEICADSAVMSELMKHDATNFSKPRGHPTVSVLTKKLLSLK